MNKITKHRTRDEFIHATRIRIQHLSECPGWLSSSLQMASLQGTQCIIFLFPTLQRGSRVGTPITPSLLPSPLETSTTSILMMCTSSAQVTIMGQLYSGKMDTSLVNTPTITPGKVPLVTILQTNDM